MPALARAIWVNDTLITHVNTRAIKVQQISHRQTLAQSQCTTYYKCQHQSNHSAPFSEKRQMPEQSECMKQFKCKCQSNESARHIILANTRVVSVHGTLHRQTRSHCMKHRTSTHIRAVRAYDVAHRQTHTNNQSARIRTQANAREARFHEMLPMPTPEQSECVDYCGNKSQGTQSG